MSTRETAVAALAELLRQTGATVWRDTDIPTAIPPEGLITVAEGDANVEAVMSPLQWDVDQACEIAAHVVARDEPDRDAAMDRLLADIGARIVADRTLGGAVQWAAPGAPSFSVSEIDGAAKCARFTVTLSFTTADSPLS